MTKPDNQYPKICFVKTAWSDDYQGTEVYGRHEHVEKYKDGNEKFNFKVGPDGDLYGYIPPFKVPNDPENWLVIFVAASTHDNGKTFGPVLPVGWYEDAVFLPDSERPEYQNDQNFPISAEGLNYTYNIRSNKAYLIPVEHRNVPLPKEYGRKLGMISRSEVRSPAPHFERVPWRDAYARYAVDLVNKFDPNKADQSGQAIEASSLSENPTKRGYASSEHRRLVEKAAEDVAKTYFKKQFLVKDVTKENLGYDFHLRDRNDGQSILLEVKGTSGSKPAFYLTRNELKCLRSNKETYKLFLVTDALSASPVKHEYTALEVEDEFALEPLSYQVNLKSPPN